MYEQTQPGVLIRFVGQPPVQATVYQLQKLRCQLCGQIFTAQAPESAGTDKYDPTVASMIGLLKYGGGFPFNRFDGLQEDLEIPLPASTQWEIVSEASSRMQPALEELIRQAAQGDVMYNDDTTVKILELMGARAKAAALAELVDEGKVAATESGRTGLFTTGVVATHEGRRIALFFSGRRHAGENLQEVLRRRATGLPPPIQMCDALSRNRPAELQTIIANCLAHGRRQFVDINEHFPAESRYVLESIEVDLPQRPPGPRTSIDGRRASKFSPRAKRSDDGPTARLAEAADRGKTGGAQLRTGGGDLLSAQALGEADAVPARRRCTFGQ